MPATSKEVLDAYAARSWRRQVERLRERQMEFVLGRREGAHVWNIEGTRRLLDCANSGGVHSLGHLHPEIVGALQAALTEGVDAGLWALPSTQLLAFQDALAAMAPTASICRSIVTCTSTQSIDLAVMFAFRVTGRRKVVAFRHGYHGHGGYAALVTGSADEGVLEHYSLPTQDTRFFADYGDLDAMRVLLREDCAAVILEPFNYETFQPADPQFLPELEQLCRACGALLIIDETRTGLSRSGRPWMTQHYTVQPDMLVLGKGLGGGIYPVSALLTTQAIYERCMNAEKYGYLSSMGGNPLAAVVGAKVLEVTQRPALLANVARIGQQVTAGFDGLCARYPRVFEPRAVLGGIATLGLVDPVLRSRIAGDLFARGVYCHSVSLIDPPVVKFFPTLTSDAAAVAELIAALDGVGAEHG